jgi:hypothetical protein
MHYAFDQWMDREYPGCPWERYADDIVAHCTTEEQARNLRAAIASRLGTFGLELHPDKTKVVYCKDGRRRGDFEHTSFDFLGYTFRARRASGRRGLFVGFSPAMSQMARKAVGHKIRAWHLNRRSGTDLSGIAQGINPQVRGWINYYGAFYRSELYSLAMRINEHLVRWAMQKFKRLRGQPAKAWAWLDAVRQHRPRLFAHWHMLPRTNSRPEPHARFDRGLLGTAGDYIGDTKKDQSDDPSLGHRQSPMYSIAQPAAYLTPMTAWSHARTGPANEYAANRIREGGIR